MFPLPVPTTRPVKREALDEMIDKLELIYSDIRNKAFDLFLARGEKLGSDLEDWFRAERELFCLPESEVKETDTAFEIKATVPGFDVEDLHVQVLPELIVIEGKREAPVTPEGAVETFHLNEFATKRLFRQYKLGSPIDVMAVEATLEAGILKIVARKHQSALQPKQVQVVNGQELTKASPVAIALTAK